MPYLCRQKGDMMTINVPKFISPSEIIYPRSRDSQMIRIFITNLALYGKVLYKEGQDPNRELARTR
jgi:hypothetical protein